MKAGRLSTTMSAIEDRLPKPQQEDHLPSCPKCFEFLRLTHTILDARHAKTFCLYGCSQCDVPRLMILRAPACNVVGAFAFGLLPSRGKPRRAARVRMKQFRGT